MPLWDRELVVLSVGVVGGSCCSLGLVTPSSASLPLVLTDCRRVLYNLSRSAIPNELDGRLPVMSGFKEVCIFSGELFSNPSI